MAKRKIDAVEDATTTPRRTRSAGRIEVTETLSKSQRSTRKTVAQPTITMSTRVKSEVTTKGKVCVPDESVDLLTVGTPPTRSIVARIYGRTQPRRLTPETADAPPSISSKENRSNSGKYRTVSSITDEERCDSSDDDELRLSSTDKPLSPTARMNARGVAKSAPLQWTAALATRAQYAQKAGFTRNETTAPITPRRRGRPPRQAVVVERGIETGSESEVSLTLLAGTIDTLPKVETTRLEPVTSSERLRTRERETKDLFPTTPTRNSGQTSSRSPSKPTTRNASPLKPSTRKRKASEEAEPEPEPPSPPSPISMRPSLDEDDGDERSLTTHSSSQQRRKVIVLNFNPKTPSSRKRNVSSVEAVESDTEDAPRPRRTIVQIEEDDEVFFSPVKRGVRSAPTSPAKGRNTFVLPPHLIPCLIAQKRAVLRALQKPPVIACDSDEPELDNAVAYKQLSDLLEGSTKRDEGNSCMLLGPRGSGKSRLVERCISELENKAIIIRLSGWVQGNDRLALRQIAVQLAEQTGKSYLSDLGTGQEQHGDDEDVNPFLDGQDQNETELSSSSLPPSSHLPALIGMLPTLSRPTVVLVEGFDLFALHPRQALLYCLLDTVQSCQSAKGNKGLAVIGLTTRVDTLQLLEKRVKSRFSGRIVRLASPQKECQWMKIVKAIYMAEIPLNPSIEPDDLEEWKGIWKTNIEKFIADSNVVQLVNETTAIVGDMRIMARVLTPPIIHLSESSPFPSVKQLANGALTQRARPAYPFLSDLSYPTLCLLIASHHSGVSGHPVFTFEMLYETFKRQLRLSTAAPIQLHGTSIGMVRCSREVLMSAFEALSGVRIFICATAASSTTAKEFVKYRCVVEQDELKKAIDKTGQTNLKKWWNKAT